MNYKTYSFRFAEEILNSKIDIRREIEEVIKTMDLGPGSRDYLNKEFKRIFTSKGWTSEVRLFEDSSDVMAKVDFLKGRVAIEVAFSHASFLGIDMLKFQVMSYSNPLLNKIDVGVYIVATSDFQRQHFPESGGSVTYEKVVNYLPHLRSAIQVPVWVIGLI